MFTFRGDHAVKSLNSLLEDVHVVGLVFFSYKDLGGRGLKLPLHEGPQGAPEDPLPASSSVAVRVEESHRRAAVLGPAGLASALQPHAEPQQQQKQDEGQEQAEVSAWYDQGPQQPAEDERGDTQETENEQADTEV